MGFVTAAGLAVNAVLIRYAKDRDLLPSAVMGKLGVAVFAYFFVENFNLIGSDQIYIPLMCIVLCSFTVCFGNNCTKIYTSRRSKSIFLIRNNNRSNLGLVSC